MPAPRGIPQIEVTFDIDANGILSVNAKDKGTGKEQSITITGASTLPKEEVEKMVQDAENNANIDKQKREEVDIKNQADSLCYQSQSQLNELGDKIDENQKKTIEDKISELKQAIQNDHYDQMQSLQKELQSLMMDIGKNVYNTTNSDSQNSQSSDETQDVIDTNSKEA